MPRGPAEMPFLEHLEELRKRILWSLLAVVAGFAIGLWAVNQFDLITVLKAPIAPLIPGGRLTVLSPTEPLMITLKLGLIVGLVLASPVILWQLWAFLSPALYEREKKTLVPALFVGLALFLTGAVLSFLFVVPQALRVLMGFQEGAFTNMITFDNYFSFVMQLVLALGLSFELPLLMIILAALGIVETPLLNRIRRYWVVASFVLGAVLSPGADVLSMLLLTIPLLLLYEIGVLGVWVVQRRRRRRASQASAAAAAVLLFAGMAGFAAPRAAYGQQPLPPVPARPGVTPRQPGDTIRQPGRQLDTASARRLGLPSAPRQQFPPADSIISQLLELSGYTATRYLADTATIEAIDRAVQLKGNAMTERSGGILEAAAIRYNEGECLVEATGEPHFFQGGQVLIGTTARFNTCLERGVVLEAFTNLQEQGGNWFIRGNLAVDSARSRIYGGDAELTSCDLPIPHYEFRTGKVKWVSQSMIVARPAVLYVRDVPIAWVPFLFQDTKTGRRSGILIPQFGFNDIIRNRQGYNRQITNIGYFWAPNDYLDAQAQFDWMSRRYITFGLTTNYRVRNWFLNGGVTYTETRESGGGVSRSIDWRHAQQFNVTTTLNVDAHYTTNTSVIVRNSIDPLVTTQLISSNGNFMKRFPWGQFNLGLTRRENISDGSGEMSLPTLALTPKPLDFGGSVTWSPSVNFTNRYTFKTRLPVLFIPGTEPGGLDSIVNTGSSRTSSFDFQTPLRIASFNLPLSLRVEDADSTGRVLSTFKIPDPNSTDPADSITVTQFRNGGFGTRFDWNTSLALPLLFRSSWKLQPSLGIRNAGPGPFAVRSALTGGRFVTQGLRPSFGLSIAPTLFGFFPGFGGLSRIRHSFSPSISWGYSPRATIPEDFARALAGPGRPVTLESPPTQTLTVALNQNFEGKSRQAPEDTLGTYVRKFKLLSIQTTGITYDFEQAKEEGRTGWATQTVNNVLTSDLVPGFSLNLVHDLWEGPVGFETSKFSPFLTSVSTQFSITERTLRSFAALFGLARKPPAERPGQPPAPTVPLGVGGTPVPGEIRRNNLLAPSQLLTRGGQGFTANFTVNISRTRETAEQEGTTNSSIGVNTRFSPTRFWGVTWSTQYNTVDNKFEAQQIQLTRDLHEWRAAFNFTRSPNGNFAFYFAIFLTDLPDINYKYNQTTVRPEGR
ncbi:MAG: twin-arginine translocase subunit TatC [Gemmatimonadales bacterium]